MNIHQLFITLVLGGICTNSFAQPGSLDTKFNGKGIEEFTFQSNRSNDYVVATVLQPDGKQLVALLDNYGVEPTKNAVVVRLTVNGALDPTFGIGGKVNVCATVYSGFHPNAMVLQADGKIVLAGHKENGAKSILALLRLHADGSLDDTFGQPSGTKRAGYINYGGTYVGNTFKTVQVHEASGTIVAAGSLLTDGNSSDFVIGAVDRYGDIITNYGGSTNGLVKKELGYTLSDQVCGSVLDQTSGMLYIAGSTNTATGLHHQFSVMALNVTTGYTDFSFNGTGIRVLPLAPSSTNNTCASICFSSDAKTIFLAGTKDISPSSMMLYKLNRDGNSNTAFSTDGVETYPLSFAPSGSTGYSVVAESSKYVTLAGTAIVGGNSKPALVKVNAVNGERSSIFGTDGAVQVTTKDNVYSGLNLLFLPTLKKYLLSGNYSVEAFYDVILKRLDAEGDADKTYGTLSETTCFASGSESRIEDVVSWSDGKFFACGNMGVNGVLALFNPDGSLDRSFKNSLDDPGTQYVYSFFPIGSNPLPSNELKAIAKTADGKLLIAGTYGSTSGRTIFVMQLENYKGNWQRDISFGTNGYREIPFGTGDDYLQDMLVQPDGKILLYSYIYYSEYKIAVTRLDRTGTVDAATFASSSPYKGTYIHPNNEGIAMGNSVPKIQFAYHPDKSIVCAGPAKNLEMAPAAIPVFRVTEAGSFDGGFQAFLNKGSFTWTGMYSNAVYVKADGTILVGGSINRAVNGVANKDYALLQLIGTGTEKGKLDASFGKDGMLTLNKGFISEKTVTNIAEESSGSIVMTGGAIDNSGNYNITALRFYASGKPDNSFATGSNGALTIGFPTASAIMDGSFYAFGFRNFSGDEEDPGIALKANLGTGPTIKTTNLVLGDLTKTYGDKPFALEPISNSPAPVTYTLTRGTCATVDASGTVSITCATIDSGIDVVIRAVQRATTGYTSDTATTTLKIEKAVPRILFSSQGALVDSIFTLYVKSNSGTGYNVEQLDGEEYMELVPSGFAGIVHIKAQGSATFKVTFASTTNYLSGSAAATIYGYNDEQAPKANDDKASLAFGEQTNVAIDVLSNDEAYTGTIVTQKIDLNPATKETDSIFVSPSLGLFEVNTSTGIVTYTPFTGFIGSGEITYTVSDSRKNVSNKGVIRVEVAPKAAIPDLKATELITPNNDGLNEAFVIGYLNLEKENSLKVFDRNGQEIFTRTNYQNDWTGELNNGRQAENGIYYFLFTEGNAGGQREIKGVVEIRR